MIALSRGPQLSVSNYTITPTHDIHHVVGEFGGHISTINTPSPDFSGFLILINDTEGLALWGDGNINLPSGVGWGPGRATILIYDKDISKWFVSSAT